MGRYSSTPQTIWTKIRLLEPAMLRAIITAIVGALAVWGVNAADLGGKIGTTWALLFPLIALVQGWWTRTVVSPSEINGIE